MAPKNRLDLRESDRLQEPGDVRNLTLEPPSSGHQVGLHELVLLVLFVQRLENEQNF